MTPVMLLVQKMEHATLRNYEPQLHMIFDIICTSFSNIMVLRPAYCYQVHAYLKTLKCTLLFTN